MHGLSSSKSNRAAMGPLTTTLTVAGLILGAMSGFGIGGIGVAARGTAHGVPAWAVVIVLAVVLAVIGNRIGAGLERRPS